MKAFKVEIDPNNVQRTALLKHAGAARWAYNFGLRYGISEQQYMDLLTEHGGCCAFCHNEFDATKKEPMIDHEHVSGKVRGLLCMRCNTMLGYANDDVAVLVSAIGYLKNTGTASSAACLKSACRPGGSGLDRLAQAKLLVGQEPNTVYPYGVHG